MIRIKKNIILAPYTTFKIGGPARFFCEVETEEELKEAIKYAKENKLKIFILGGGTNILVSNKGFDGVVIRILYTLYLIHNTYVECGSGVLLSQIVSKAVKHNLSGLEWAAGIPGSIGGAVLGNAGAFGGDMSGVVERVKVFDAVNLKSSEIKDFKFGYRKSVFKENPHLVILSCVLKLQKGNKAEIENKMKEIIKKRIERLPRESSAGSFFKNPVVKNHQIIDAFEKDAGVKCEGGKVPAGWLIEEAGLSGKKIGGVKVSEKHNNFVINTGGGKAEEVVMLVSLIKQKVRQKFNLELEEEIRYVGF